MDTAADVTMTGETTNNIFGNSVSSAGDVNGDGYTDVIVGAYGYSINTGRSYIYFGGCDCGQYCRCDNDR
ncbi:MAG: FG-GAP repeat protein [Ignavibacteria bacterium]|nr:FG-GAP repeat protein [Ignavibacteria bacterium]